MYNPIPLLIEHDRLLQKLFHLNNNTHKCREKTNVLKLCFYYDFGHSHVRPLSRVSLTFIITPEVEKGHVQFHYPITSKLYNLLRRAEPDRERHERYKKFSLRYITHVVPARNSLQAPTDFAKRYHLIAYSSIKNWLSL